MRGSSLSLNSESSCRSHVGKRWVGRSMDAEVADESYGLFLILVLKERRGEVEDDAEVVEYGEGTGESGLLKRLLRCAMICSGENGRG